MDQASFLERIPKEQYLIMGLMCVCVKVVLSLNWNGNESGSVVELHAKSTYQ